MEQMCTHGCPLGSQGFSTLTGTIARRIEFHIHATPLPPTLRLLPLYSLFLRAVCPLQRLELHLARRPIVGSY